MNPYSRSSIIVAVLFVTVLALAGPTRAEVTVPWTVSKISGKALVTESSEITSRPLLRGEVLNTGDRIETGEDGNVVVKRGKQSILVAANSSFEIVATESSLLTRIYQSFGTLMFQVDKRPEKHFQVNTPYLHAVVKGTTFTVNVDEGGATVHVTDGLVEVSEPVANHRILVARGHTVSIGSSDGSTLIKGVGANYGGSEHGPKIESDLGTGKLNIEQASDGLLRSQEASKPGAAGKKDNPLGDVDGEMSSDGKFKTNRGGNAGKQKYGRYNNPGKK